MPQLTDDVTYPPISPMLPEDRFVLVTSAGIRKLLLSALQVPADQIPVDDSGFTELQGNSLAEILTYLDANGVGGGGVTFDPPVIVTLELTDEQPSDSWFGNGSLWKLYPFTVTSTEAFVFAPAEFESTTLTGEYIEQYVFNAADLVGGTIQPTAANLPDFYQEHSSEPGAGVSPYVHSLPLGDYVLAIGVWSMAGEGTTIDITPPVAGLEPVATGLPSIGTNPSLPSYPLGIDEAGELRHYFPMKYDINPPRGMAALSNGIDNIASGTGSFASGYASVASGLGSTAIGNSEATGSYSTAIGMDNEAGGLASVIIGSFNTDNTLGYVTLLGRYNMALADSTIGLGEGSRPRWAGSLAHSSNNYQGKRQTEKLILSAAGNTRLTPNTPFPVSSTAVIRGNVIARNNTTSVVKAWDIRLVVAVTSGGVARLVGSTKTVIAEDATASTWDLTLAFDANGISITPVGLPSTNEVVVASLEITESLI